MIAKASNHGKRGADTYGLLRYLFGPGQYHVHTDPHLVAAWDPEWLPGGAFADMISQRGGLATLGRHLDAAMTGHEVDVDGGHVYHVVLSVPPSDSNPDPQVGLFGDTCWRDLVESAIEHMGLAPDEQGGAGCRWVAVHHGLSSKGNDHVHLVVNVVRGDGRLADLYRDWPRWRLWCRQVEDRYDLTRTAPAGEGRAQSVTRPELERAARARTTTERDRLRRLLTAAAAEAGSEPEFVALLRHQKILVAPRLTGGCVVGYKVALDPSDSDAVPFWLAGSTLRRDLSLPRLRARWEAPALPDRHALLLWTGELDTGLAPATRHRHTWRQVTRLLEHADTALRRDLTANDTDNAHDPVVNWHQAVERTADLLTVLVRAEPAASQWPRVHDQLTRAAQLPRGRRPSQDPGVAIPLLTRAARLAAISRDPAPLVLTVMAMLVYSILTVLARQAERRALRSAALQQISTAVNVLATHPAIKEGDASRLG